MFSFLSLSRVVRSNNIKYCIKNACSISNAFYNHPITSNYSNSPLNSLVYVNYTNSIRLFADKANQQKDSKQTPKDNKSTSQINKDKQKPKTANDNKSKLQKQNNTQKSSPKPENNKQKPSLPLKSSQPRQPNNDKLNNDKTEETKPKEKPQQQNPQSKPEETKQAKTIEIDLNEMTPEMEKQFSELMNESLKMTKEEFDSIELDENILKDLKDRFGIELPNLEYKFENKEDEERYNSLFTKPFSSTIVDLKNQLSQDVKELPDTYADYYIHNKRVLHGFEDLLNGLEYLNSREWSEGMRDPDTNEPIQPWKVDEKSVTEGRDITKKLKEVIDKTPNPATISQFVSQYAEYDPTKEKVENLKSNSILLNDLSNSWKAISKMGTKNPKYDPTKPTVIEPTDPKEKDNTNMRVRTYNYPDLSDQENVIKSCELEKEIDEGYGTDFDENLDHPDEFFQIPNPYEKVRDEFMEQFKKKPKPKKDTNKKKKRYGKKK